MGTKHILDPVHGAIDLNQVEVDVIDTPSFQRLRRIRQLAMASQVYPGADHSRFVHSLGVFSIMCRLTEHLRGERLKEKDIQKLRLAALLHDIGHYPYSHLMEKVPLPPEVKTDEIRAKRNVPKAERAPGSYPGHEEIGQRVLTKRKDISSVLKTYGNDPLEIAQIFQGRHPIRFYNQLAASGLDVDRLDYMLRDAHYSGVPYGKIDLEYILRNVSINSKGEFCISPKAIPSTEHFLLSRWYNYGQIVFQKTVMGMEALIVRLLERMVQNKTLPDSAKKIYSIVENESEFLHFDDSFINEKIRQLALAKRLDSPENIMACAILNRIKPRCVYEGVADVKDGEGQKIKLFAEQIPQRIKKWTEKFNIDPDFWVLGDSKPRSLEEASLYSTLSDEQVKMDDPTNDRAKQMTKVIKVANTDETSTYLIDDKTSQLNPLSQATFRVVRLFVLFPSEVEAATQEHLKRNWRNEFKKKAERIKKHIEKDLRLT